MRLEGTPDDCGYLAGLVEPQRRLERRAQRGRAVAVAVEVQSAADVATVLEAAAATGATVHAVRGRAGEDEALNALLDDVDGAVGEATVALRVSGSGQPVLLRPPAGDEPATAGGAGARRGAPTRPDPPRASERIRTTPRGRLILAIALVAALPALIVVLAALVIHRPEPVAAPAPVATAPRSLPGDRGAPAVAWDPTTRRLVLTTGSGREAADRGELLDDTWTWDGSWHPAPPGEAPPARVGAAMTSDPATRSLLLTGGFGSGGSGPLDDTWLWDGTRWTARATATQPASATLPALATDQRGPVLLTSQAAARGTSTTWRWNGDDWSALTIASPPLRSTAVMATDGTGGTLVLVEAGENGGGQTWTFDGAAWSVRAAAGPEAYDPLTAALAWDPTDRRLLLVDLGPGGTTRARAWVDGRWIQAPAAAPPGHPVALVTDTSSGRLLALEADGMGNLQVLVRSAGGWRP